MQENLQSANLRVMARPLRIACPGALYHVASRGNGKADIFLDDTDRRTFIAVLDAVCQRMHGRCYAYCLMTNHAHLVRELTEGNLSGAMRQLNGVYTQCFNRPHDRVGGISGSWMTTESNDVPEPDPHR